MNIYYEVVAKCEGEIEVLFGSFNKSDCKCEIEAEKESWKDDGYRSIKIVSRETEDTPDPEVYEVVTKHELFMQQAPSFNFELSEEEILEKALEVGFVTKIEGKDDQYLINHLYKTIEE